MKALRSDFPSTCVTTISEEAMITSMSRWAVEHQFPVGLATVECCVQSSQLDPERPASFAAFYMNQMIAGPPILAVGRRGRRRHANHRDRAQRPLDARGLAAVVMPMQDEFTADSAD